MDEAGGHGRVDDGSDEDDGQRRCEVLAALCLAAAATVLVYGISQALATALAVDGAAGGPSGWQLVEVAAGSSVFFPVLATGTAGHGMLVLAYVLVLLVSPGSWVGSLGTRILQAMLAVSGLFVLSGAITVARIVRTPGNIESGFSVSPSFDGTGERPDAIVSVVERGGTALPVVVGMAVAGFVGWTAYRAVASPPGLDDGDAEVDPDRDLDPYGADEDPIP